MMHVTHGISHIDAHASISALCKAIEVAAVMQLLALFLLTFLFF